MVGVIEQDIIYHIQCRKTDVNTKVKGMVISVYDIYKRGKKHNNYRCSRGRKNKQLISFMNIGKAFSEYHGNDQC